MKRFIRFLAAGSATVAFAGVANAQITFTRPPSGYGSPQPGTGAVLFNLEIDPNNGNAAAMGTPFAYDFYWHSNSSAGLDWLWSGPFMWTFFNIGTPNFGGPGDSIRVCYGIDVTQGGRNWSGTSPTTIGSTPGPWDGGTGAPGGSTSENTWFRWSQGFAPGQNLKIGLMSVQAHTSSARGADTCFGPTFHGQFVSGGALTPHAGESGGHKVAAAIIPGVIGPATAPFPAIWEMTFAWGPTPALVPNVIGDNSLDPGIPVGLSATGGGLVTMNIGLGSASMPGPVAPLLANVIFEVQAPINAGFSNSTVQYYLASTSEFTGIDALLVPMGATSGLGYIGTGGISNGNGNMGLDLFGGGAPPNHAGDTNRVSGSRVFAVAGGFITGSAPPGILFPANQQPTTPSFRDGRMEFAGQLAFATPKLHAYHGFETTPVGMRPSVTAKGGGHTPRPNGPAGSANTLAFWAMAAPFTTLPGAQPFARMEGVDGHNHSLIGPGNFMLFTGSGGPDWRVTSAPLSKVDIIAIDHETGAEAVFNIYAKVNNYATPTTAPTFTGTPLNPAYFANPAALDTSIGYGGKITPGPATLTSRSCRFNALMVFLYTFHAPTLLTVNNRHPQLPGSWGYAVLPPAGTAGDEHTQGQAGHPFSLSVNVKQGTQTVPLGFITGDPLFGPFLADSFFTFSTRFSPSDDLFADGALDYGGNVFPFFASIFQGMWEPETSGQADLKGPPLAGSGGGTQVFVGFPDPALAGVGLNVAGQSVAFNNCTGGPAVLVINEVANSLRISFQ